MFVLLAYNTHVACLSLLPKNYSSKNVSRLIAAVQSQISANKSIHPTFSKKEQHDFNSQEYYVLLISSCPTHFNQKTHKKVLLLYCMCISTLFHQKLHFCSRRGAQKSILLTRIITTFLFDISRLLHTKGILHTKRIKLQHLLHTKIVTLLDSFTHKPNIIIFRIPFPYQFCESQRKTKLFFCLLFFPRPLI